MKKHPSAKEQANIIVEEIASSITFLGQSKQEIYDDAKVIAKLMVKNIKDSNPTLPCDIFAPHKMSQALWYWQDVDKHIDNYTKE